MGSLSLSGGGGGVKRQGRGFDHPPTPIAEVKESVELYVYSLSGPLWPVLGRNLPSLLYPYLTKNTEIIPRFALNNL
jgi:hypothetical protein